jgi:hypothetical protein
MFIRNSARARDHKEGVSEVAVKKRNLITIDHWIFFFRYRSKMSCASGALLAVGVACSVLSIEIMVEADKLQRETEERFERREGEALAWLGGSDLTPTDSSKYNNGSIASNVVTYSTT